MDSQTKEKIKDLLPPASIDKNTALVLVNAIYFKVGIFFSLFEVMELLARNAGLINQNGVASNIPTT